MGPFTGRALVVLAAVVVVGLVGCTSEDPPADAEQDRVTPEASEVDSGVSSPRAAPDPPEFGDCWDVPPGKAWDHTYWYDDSPRVPCSSPHTMETVAVYPMQHGTVEEAELMLTGCFADARRHLGVDLQHWIPWGMAAFIYPGDADDSDPMWVRCDVAFPADYPASRPRRHTYPTVDAARALADELWGCLDDDPLGHGRQSLVPCSQRHRYEATGTLAVLEAYERYPSPGRLAAATRQCRPGRTPHQWVLDLAVVADWGGRAQWESSNGEIVATCWAYDRDGAMLPPLP